MPCSEIAAAYVSTRQVPKGALWENDSLMALNKSPPHTHTLISLQPQESVCVSVEMPSEHMRSHLVWRSKHTHTSKHSSPHLHEYSVVSVTCEIGFAHPPRMREVWLQALCGSLGDVSEMRRTDTKAQGSRALSFSWGLILHKCSLALENNGGAASESSCLYWSHL